MRWDSADRSRDCKSSWPIAGLALAAALLSQLFLLPGSPARAATTAEAGAASATLRLLNAERAANHLPALKTSSALLSSARRHNLAMAKANALSHQLPGEPAFTTRISQAGVSWHSVAENIGVTTNRSSAGAQALETAMYNEKAPNNGHRLNILSSSVRYVGIDAYIDARTGKLWLTEDFADAAGPQSAAAPAATVAATAVAAHNPIGALDSISVLPGHKVRMVGWALDPDNKSIPLLVAVYYDGKYAGRYRAPVARSDVAKAYRAGLYEGYSIVLTLPAGRHTISTYAINIGIGNAAPKLGSRVGSV